MRSGGRGVWGPKGFFATALPARKITPYKAGETIVSQGDACTDVCYIEEGLVKLTLVSNRGKSAVLGILGPGDFFGEGCISEQSQYLTSAVALIPSSVSIIKRKTMIRLIEQDRSLCTRFIKYLLARSQRIDQNLIDHLLNSSEKRLARTLLLLAKSGAGNKLIFKKISQDTLAEMVGTTRSRINFFMNKFRKSGFIHYNGDLKIHSSLASVLGE
jgi:CRP/FNR family transcriptional regulator, cyclic AMP receptor protein